MFDLLSRAPGIRVSDRVCRTGPAIGWDRVKHTIIGTRESQQIHRVQLGLCYLLGF